MGRKRVLYGAAVLLAVLVGVLMGQAFFSRPDADLLNWDQASRADDAIRLAKEFRFFEIPRFVVHVLSLNWWPPLHPLIMFPFFLILGPTIDAAIIPSLAAFVLAILSILFLFENLSSVPLAERGPGAVVLLTLSLTSPLLLSSATWAMLEIFGIGLTCLALGFYFRARRTGTASSYRTCAVLLFLLWTLKYNYGLFLTLVLLVLEVRRSLPAHWREHFTLRKMRVLLKPVFWPAYALLAVLVWTALGGRTAGTIFGVRFSFSNIYNPLMFLYLYLLIVTLYCVAKNWKWIQSRLQTGQREMLLWGALPLGVFLALPDKIKAIIKNFEVGRQTLPGALHGQTTFYLRSFIQDYSLWVPVGILVLALCGYAVIRLRSAPLGVRALMLFSVLGFLFLTAGFKLQESRYLATYVPPLWVAAAWSVDVLSGKLPRAARDASAAILMLALVALLVFHPLPVSRAIAQPWAVWAHQDSSVRPMVDLIVDQTRDAHRLFISGTQDARLSPLLGLKLQMAHYGRRDFRLELDSSDAAHDTTSAFGNMTERGETDGIVLMIVRNGAGESLLLKWMERLRSGSGYTLVKEQDYAEPLLLKLIFFAKK